MKSAERKQMLKERLEYVNQQLRDVDVFQLPLDPHMVSTGIIVEKSRVMGSKQAPIWLTFENAIDPEHPHVVMFKAGKYLSEESEHRVYGSTVVDISMTPPCFKPVSLSLSRSPLSITPKQVFFNPINIF